MLSIKELLAQQIKGLGAKKHLFHFHRDLETQNRYDCTRRLALAIDISIPTAKPNVTMAVPP